VISTRKPESGLLHHSDRGSQYASGDFQSLVNEHGIDCSMSGAGNCYDDAVAECDNKITTHFQVKQESF
jgi:transposase InsO family protein